MKSDARATCVLALNAGSSSLKFDLAIVASDRVVGRPLSGSISGFGRRATRSETLSGLGTTSRIVSAESLAVATHLAIRSACEVAAQLEMEIDAVAHRIVHGGTRFVGPTHLDRAALRELERLAPLAPNHQLDSLSVVRIAKDVLPRARHIGVFDTAFHSSLPESAWRLPIPRDDADRLGLRRFGFHGIAYESVMERLPSLLGRPRGSVNAILLHLGSGCSACAIRRGASIDTTMGATPLDGLMMRTRSGGIDPAVPLRLQAALSLSADAVEDLLTRESGLLGVGGHGGDVRALLRAEGRDRAARVALEMFVSRIRQRIGAYLTELPRVDAIAFSGGIGENSSTIRQRVLVGLESLGIRLDGRANAVGNAKEARITSPRSSIAAYVVPADEARVLARSVALLAGRPRSG